MKQLLLFSFFVSTLGFAQSQDAEVWTGIGLKANINKKFSLKYESQARFFKNASTLKTYYNELAANYEVIDNLKLGASYRYSRRNRESHFASDNRISLNSSYGFKLGKTGLKLKTRARYQYSFNRFGVINDFIYPDIDHLFRCKFELAYKNKSVKRISPFVGYELFKNIQPAGVIGLDAYRAYGGLDFDLPARHELQLKYIYELENGNQPSLSLIHI